MRPLHTKYFPHARLECLLYLDHIVFSHQDRLLLLQAVGASLAPDLGPLDPGGLMG